MQDPITSFLGPGSQPGDEDGTTLDYMQMPSGMMTFATPDLPESEEAKGLETGMAALEQVLSLLQDYRETEQVRMVSLLGLDPQNLGFVGQVLGEGEVSLIAGSSAQAQEAVLAGVWRESLN